MKILPVGDELFDAERQTDWQSETFLTLRRTEQDMIKNVQDETKNGNFWKTHQKLKKSKKKNYWQKLNHYNLPFKRQ